MAVPTQEMITEWKLDMKGNAKKIQDFVKEMKAEARAERAVEYASKRAAGEIDNMGRKVKTAGDKAGQASTNIKSMGSSVAASATKFLAAGAAILGFGRAIGSALRTGLDYEDWIGNNIKSLDGMKAATAGMISELELARTRTRLTTGDYKLNEEQLQAVAKAAIVLTRINKTSFATSLDNITKSIKTGSTRALKELGFNVDLLGKSSDKTAEAVAMVTKRFGGMSIAAENTNEKIDIAKNRFESMVGQVGQAILKSDALTTALQDMSDVGEWLLKKWKGASPDNIYGLMTDKDLAEMGTSIDYLNFGIKKKLAETAKAHKADLDKLVAQSVEAEKWADSELAKLSGAKGKKSGKAFADGFKFEVSKIKSEMVPEFKAMADKLKAEASKTQPSIEFQIDSLFGFLLDDAVASSAKVAANVKAAMTAATSVPISNIPLARIFDEEMFLKLQAGNAEFASIKTKMDAMAATGDVASAAYMKLAAQLNKVGAATVSAANKVTAFRTSVNETTADVVDMGIGAFSSFASSLWSVADAAIQSGESFSAAIAKALKASLLALAAEATAKAIFSLAEYALSGFTDASKLVAAGLYGAVAIAAGAAGLGMSAATASSSGSTTAQSNTTTGTQQFGQTVEDKRPVNINVFFNDPYDPSSAFVRSRSISTAIGRQQTVSS